MNSKIICLLSAMVVFAGCTQNFPSTVSTPYPPYTYNPLATNIPLGGNPNPTFDPLEVEKGALPEVRDLPSTPIVDRAGPARKYTGIIKNKTAYEVSVPSSNSAATLIIPARGWIAYTAYARHFNLTAYQQLPNVCDRGLQVVDRPEGTAVDQDVKIVDDGADLSGLRNATVETVANFDVVGAD